MTKLVTLCLSATVIGYVAIACGFAGDNEVETMAQVTDTFVVSGVPTLIIENANGRVEVIGGGDSAEIRVEAELRRPERIDYRATQDAGTIRIAAKELKSGKSWWERLRLRNGSANIAVTAPHNTDVEVRSSNGHIILRNVAGHVELRTSNGPVEAQGADGRYDIYTSNGKITVEEGLGEFNLRTSNGAIRFEGELSQKTENRFRTSNGSIRAVLAGESPNVRVKAATSNGGINIARDITVSEMPGKNRLEGIIGKGDASLTLTTSNGSITIE